jgi:hypothetical protein
MRSTFTCFFFILSFKGFVVFAQKVKEQLNQKGNFFIYWGWNRDAYSKSDIRFRGSNYDFTLENVIAKDRQYPFDFRVYFSPKRLTIPQYNFRLGYFISNHISISIGADHMKYVMLNYIDGSPQKVQINGHIENTASTYDKTYTNDTIALTPDFLLFEHTDGLNYENIELRRYDVLFARKKITFSLSEGFGAGILIPRTNTTLLKNARYDEFHLSGYGSSVILALNMTYFNHFFIQSEWKGGFIHMPDIRTTMHQSDRASQHFWFSQYNIVFGVKFKLNVKKQNKSNVNL